MGMRVRGVGDGSVRGAELAAGVEEEEDEGVGTFFSWGATGGVEEAEACAGFSAGSESAKDFFSTGLGFQLSIVRSDPAFFSGSGGASGFSSARNEVDSEKKSGSARRWVFRRIMTPS